MGKLKFQLVKQKYRRENPEKSTGQDSSKRVGHLC